MDRQPRLAILPNLRKVKWNEWEHLSKKGRRMKTWGKGCGHTMWISPFSINFLTSSLIVFMRAMSCPLLDQCQAVDEWHKDQDFLYESRYSYPHVRPVNFNGALVLNQDGQILGPLTHMEWMIHSFFLWDIFHKLIQGKNQTNN